VLAPEPVTASSLAPLAAALLLGVVHGVAPYLHVLRGTPRSVWLSLAGGVSVAYVFVHLLPELAAGEALLERGLVQAKLAHQRRDHALVGRVEELRLLSIDQFAHLPELALRARALGRLRQRAGGIAELDEMAVDQPRPPGLDVLLDKLWLCFHHVELTGTSQEI